MKINQDFSLSWIGHATFRVKTPGGKTILVDPWLEENPSCRIIARVSGSSVSNFS